MALSGMKGQVHDRAQISQNISFFDEVRVKKVQGANPDELKGGGGGGPSHFFGEDPF